MIIFPAAAIFSPFSWRELCQSRFFSVRFSTFKCQYTLGMTALTITDCRSDNRAIRKNDSKRFKTYAVRFKSVWLLKSFCGHQQSAFNVCRHSTQVIVALTALLAVYFYLVMEGWFLIDQPEPEYFMECSTFSYRH